MISKIVQRNLPVSEVNNPILTDTTLEVDVQLLDLVFSPCARCEDFNNQNRYARITVMFITLCQIITGDK